MAWSNWGYPYDEAVEKSLCFKCANRDSCFKPDTKKRKGYNFKPVTFCTQYKEK